VLHQVRVYYDASLDYGRSTMPDSGLFYLGAAQAQREFAAFCRLIAAPAGRKGAAGARISAEIAALQRDLLSVYRPPVSIDRHPEFIAASGVLKEARELDAAGLRYGALLRYLEAARRFAPLRPATASAAGTLEKRLGRFAARLEAGGVDHSLGRLFLEAAQADMAHPAAGAGPRSRRRSPTTCCRDISPRSRPRAGEAGDRPRVTGDAGALAVYLKPLRPGRSAGAERGFGVRRQGEVRGGELRRLEAGEEPRRDPLPAIFVDDVLVATPSDFGFYGKGETEGGGRYTPFKSAASHDRFRADLTRMITLILEGRKESARAQAAPAPQAALKELPALSITDLDGRPLTRADLAGRPVLVEFWATWCPPCRSTLGWLGDLKRRHGDRLAVVAIAVQSGRAGSPEGRRRAQAADRLGDRHAGAGARLRRRERGPDAVPVRSDGRTAAAYYGAPPTLHSDAEAALASLLR